MFVRKSTYKKMQQWAERNQTAYHRATQMNFEILLEMELLRDALNDIIKQQTKAGNATVTRMVKIATEALEGERVRQEPTSTEE